MRSLIFEVSPRDSAVLLRDDDAGSKSGQRTEGDVKRARDIGLFVAIPEWRHVCEPVA